MEENIIDINRQELTELVDSYYNQKNILDEYKKSTDKLNSEIKDTFNNLGITEFETDTVKAKVSIQKRESFNEDKLIEKLKTLNGYTAIKTKEYVDMDELEDLIYNGHIDASQLSNCKIVKEVVTLKVTERK